MYSKVLKTVKLNNDETQVTRQIAKETGTLTLPQVKALIQKIRNKGEKEYEYFDIPLIKILNGDRWASFKTLDDFNDYYEGFVKDTEKFDDILQLQVTTIYA